MTPQTFGGESYRIWTVKMQAYLEDLDLWEALEDNTPLLPFQTIQRWRK